MQTITVNYSPENMPWLAGLFTGNRPLTPDPWPLVLTRAERKILKRKKRIPVSEWAEKYRVLTMSALPGPWKNERTPHLVGIMDASGFPSVQTVILCKSPQTGGPLALDTKIPTASGWKYMEDMSVGDVVFDENGQQCEVTSVSEVFAGRDCFELTFDDGSKIVSDAGHRWSVTDVKNRKHPKKRTLTTGEISLSYTKKEFGKNRNRYAIPVSLPLRADHAELPISPYALGVWLGDGNAASNQITTHDDDVEEMARHISESGHQCVVRKPAWCKGSASNIIIGRVGNKHYETCIREHRLSEVGTFINKKGALICRECHRQSSKHSQHGFVMDRVIRTPFFSKLKDLNLINNKHIPAIYLRASYEQRLELAQGLMDTDGNASKNRARCEITLADERLCRDVFELLTSLGIKATIKTRLCSKTGWGVVKNPQIHYRIGFTAYADRPIFKLQRKASLMTPIENAGLPSKSRRRRIVRVRQVESVPVKCIGVDSKNHLFLAGETMIPTHNSECVHNFVGYCIDTMPGPVLYVYPDELIGRENMRDRIQPMIESSPRLRTYLTGTEDDRGLLRMNLVHMPLYIAWARSASRLSNKPIRYVVFDETDKYPETAGPKETDPISLGEARTITYENTKKLFKISTPTTEGNFIWQALTKEAQVIFDYWVRCPECGRDQKMLLVNIRVPEDCHDPNIIEAKGLAWYQCAHCSAKWGDHQRNQAVKMGGWRERVPDDSGRMPLTLETYLNTYKPKKIGFHLPSWISPFVSLSKIMSDWFGAQRDKTRLKDFFNKHAAEPWRHYTGDRKEDYIIKLKDDRPRGLVPSGNIISGVTAIIDTQDNGFFFEIRAWGYGFEQESWQIREGFADSFAALEQILWGDEYKDSSGGKYLVRVTLIDAMGHRTAEVYDWCRKNRGRVIPLKGEERMNRPYAFSKIDCYPGTNKPILGGIQLLRVNTNHYKDQLAAKLDINPADPGAWHMHSEMSNDWALMMVSEFVNDKGLWECKSNMANHAWDISGYGLAAADWIGLKYKAKDSRIQGVEGSGGKKAENARHESETGVERPGWMGKR